MNYYSNSGRVFFGGPVTRTVKLLIAVNVAVFLVQVALYLVGTRFLETYFGLIPARVTRELMIWQLGTYMFLHDVHNPLHIFWNMLILFMLGNDLERYWGTRRFLKFYLWTGVGAGLCSWVVSVNALVVIIGASGAIYGLLAAYGVLYANRIILFNFLFPMKVKYLVLIMGAIAFISSLTAVGSGVAHVAHLGGMVVGFVYVKSGDWMARWRTAYEQRRREALKRRFEVYYGEVRRKIDEEKRKGPTIH